MCGSVEEKAFNANMELTGVVESERNAIRKRHVWKLLEEQDRVLRSYYAQREGFEKRGQGMQGQTGLGREHVGHGVCKRQKTKMDWLCRSRGRRTAAKSWNAAGAGVQLLSEDNLAGGVRASREGRG